MYLPTCCLVQTHHLVHKRERDNDFIKDWNTTSYTNRCIKERIKITFDWPDQQVPCFHLAAPRLACSERALITIMMHCVLHSGLPVSIAVSKDLRDVTCATRAQDN